MDKQLSFLLEKFSLESEKQLRPKGKRFKDPSFKPKNAIEYDTTGLVVRDKLQVLTDRPNYKIYPLSGEEEQCAFCRGSSTEEELRVKVGPMYGPLKLHHSKEGAVYVHEMCALWTPEIFLDNRNKFKNLKKAVKRCNKLTCKFCKERGGGLGCFVKSCDATFHYLCAKLSNCLFVNTKFIVYCEQHRTEAPQECLDEEDSIEEEDNIEVEDNL